MPARRYEVDFHWPEPRVIVETDGVAFHSTTAAGPRDRVRDRDLRRAGWIVLRCGWRDVVAQPEPLVGRLRRRLTPP